MSIELLQISSIMAGLFSINGKIKGPCTVDRLFRRRTGINACLEVISAEFVGKAPKVNDSFDGRSSIQPSILWKIQIHGRVLIAAQIEAHKERAARKFSGVGNVDTKVVLDIRFWKRLVSISAVWANIDCVG